MNSVGEWISFVNFKWVIQCHLRIKWTSVRVPLVVPSPSWLKLWHHIWLGSDQMSFNPWQRQSSLSHETSMPRRDRMREIEMKTGSECAGRMAWQQKRRDRAMRLEIRNLFLVGLFSEGFSAGVEPINIQHRGSFTSSHNRQEKAQLTNMKIKIFACLYTCAHDHTWHGGPWKSQNWLQLVLYWWATSRGRSTDFVCIGGREEWRKSPSGPVHTYRNVLIVANPTVRCSNVGPKKVLKYHLKNIIISI